MADSSMTSTKKYVLDHILYEMEMYLYTYRSLRTMTFPDILMFNTYWNAHNVALRNLMVFFGISGQIGKDELAYNSFSFAEQPPNRKNRQSFYSPLSKAINHISIQRFEGYNGQSLDEKVKEVQETVFPEMKQYIRMLINHLDTERDISYTFRINDEERIVNISDELRDGRVKGMIEVVKSFLHEIELSLS